MAIKANFNGASLRAPGAYSKTSVNLTGGFPIAETGIVGIVGEADLGMPGSADDIRENFFSPEQFGEVVSKYSSGPIVDAFRLLIAPSSDLRIVNGAQKIYIYKTNAATKASAAMATAYGTVYSLNYGFDQNTISFQVSDSQTEVLPAPTTFSWITDALVGNLRIRVNGAAKEDIALGAMLTPTLACVALAAGTGIACTGGVNRNIISAGMIAGGETIAITFGADGLTAEIDVAAGGGVWGALPVVGDSLYIPATSPIKGGADQNVGGYIITAVTTTKISVIKMSGLPVSGLTVIAADIAAVTDVMAYSPLVLTSDATTPAGQGAALELCNNAGTIAVEELMYGGNDRAILTATQVADTSRLKLDVVSGLNVSITIDSAFAATPAVGDILTIRPGSILRGAANVNLGNYRITAVTASNILATMIRAGGAPGAVAYADIVATTDLMAFEGVLSSASIPLLNVSSAEREVTIALDMQSDGSSEDSASLGGNVAMEIGYDGTTAVMTIGAVYLTVARVGGSGADLSIKISDYDTIQQLVDFIDAQTGYSAAVANNIYASYSPALLDRVSAISICEEHPGSMPGRIKLDSYEIQSFFDASAMASLTRTAFVGLPINMTTATFLAGAVKGGTSAASVSLGIDEMQKVRINSLVPLFSRDATTDIIDGLTEPSSGYMISAINAAAKTHVLLMSDTKKRSERDAYCSYKGTYTLTKAEANNLSNARVSMCIQDVRIMKTDGTLDWASPWALAAVCAGMQAGAPIGEPMTYKYINILGIRHASFDPSTQYDDAIDNGLLFVEQPSQGGFRIVVGNTTYSTDDNFVYNRISTQYTADTVAYNLRQQLENIYVGVNSAFADAQSIKNTVVSIMQTFLAAGMITGDDTNAGRGYKNLVVRIVGSTASVDITITPAQGIDFILATIQLDTIRMSA